jgi:hypothetical protein
MITEGQTVVRSCIALFFKHRGFNAYGARAWSMCFRCIQKVARRTSATRPVGVRDSVRDVVNLDTSMP